MMTVPGPDVVDSAVVGHQGRIDALHDSQRHISPNCTAIKQARQNQTVEKLKTGSNREALVEKNRQLHLPKGLSRWPKSGFDFFGDVQTHGVLGSQVLVGRHNSQCQDVGLGLDNHDRRLVLVENLWTMSNSSGSSKTEDRFCLPCIQNESQTTISK